MHANNGLIFQVLKTPPCDLGVTPSAKSILLTMLDYWNPKRSGPIVFPGQARLAWQTGLKVRAVRDAIRALESAGLIKTRRQRNTPNRYQIEVAHIQRLCELAPPFGPAKSADPEIRTGNICRSGPAKSADRDRQNLPGNALDNALTTPEAFPDHFQGPRQRKMPLLGAVASQAVQKLKETG